VSDARVITLRLDRDMADALIEGDDAQLDVLRILLANACEQTDLELVRRACGIRFDNGGTWMPADLYFLEVISCIWWGWCLTSRIDEVRFQHGDPVMVLVKPVWR
jgi:hypothetical protein